MAHPRRVAPREVVVHRHELHVLPGKRVEVERKRRDERLALARLHLGYLALVEHDAADELDVERNHVPGEGVPADLRRRPAQVAARVLYECKRLGEYVVERLAFRDTVLELLGNSRKILVLKVFRLVFRLNPVNFAHNRPELLELAGVLCPDNSPSGK